MGGWGGISNIFALSNSNRGIRMLVPKCRCVCGWVGGGGGVQVYTSEVEGGDCAVVGKWVGGLKCSCT